VTVRCAVLDDYQGALYGAQLGLLGLGKIGSRVARIGQAFGMRVVAWSANLTDERAAEAGVERAPSLDSLLETPVPRSAG